MTTPPQLTESMGPVEIGAEMKRLREQFTLSQQDVSERLHIRARYVQAIENANYDAMPGKVYARGYVHTYAEFLGLDADKVVAQCFTAAPEKATGQDKNFDAKMLRSPEVKYGPNWAPIGIGLAMVVVLIAVYSQFASDQAVGNDTQVQAVPEALISSVSGNVMPTARNYECLQQQTLLNCFFAQESLHRLMQLQQDAAAAYAADTQGLAVEPAPIPEPETAPDAAAVDAPGSDE